MFSNVSILNALQLYKGQCISNLQFYPTTFFYLKYDTNETFSYVSEPISDFNFSQYDSSNDYIFSFTDGRTPVWFCIKNPNFLGMESTQYYFLLGLIGVIFGGVFMYFTTLAFISVGGKK